MFVVEEDGMLLGTARTLGAAKGIATRKPLLIGSGSVTITDSATGQLVAWRGPTQDGVRAPWKAA